MIRKAEDLDKEFCSRMYYTSGPNLFDYFFNTESDTALKVIRSLFDTDDTIFSKKYFYVCDDDECKGSLLLIPGSKLKFLENNVKKYILNVCKIIGVKKIIVSIIRSFLMKKFPHVASDELFIYAISVIEKYRGQHIGSALLSFAEDNARELSYSKLSLYVEIDNHRAIEVYKKNGFDIVATVNFSGKIKKYKVLGLYKMSKSIQY